MSSWLENGWPAIVEALAAARNRLDEEAQREILERNRSRDELLNQLQALQSRCAEVDRLQQENESLKAEIYRIHEGQKVPETLLKQRSALQKLSPNKPTNKPMENLVQHTTVAKSKNDGSFVPLEEYQKLAAKYKNLLQILEKHRSTLRKRTQTIESWAKHADAQEETIRKLQAKLKVGDVARNGALVANQDASGDARSSDGENLDHNAPQRPSSVCSSNHTTAYSPSLALPLGSVTTPNSPFAKHISSEPLLCLNPKIAITFGDDTTDTKSDVGLVDDVELPPYSHASLTKSPVAVKQEPSSDEPVVVLEQPVRKRKFGQEAPESERIQRMKLESSSSSGLELVTESHNFLPAESIDFDDEAHVPTPRKPKMRPVPNEHNVQLYARVGQPSSKYVSSAVDDTSSHVPRPARRLTTDRPTHQSHSDLRLDSGLMYLAEDEEAGSAGSDNPVARGRLDVLLHKSSTNSMARTSHFAPQRRNPQSAPTRNEEDTPTLPRRRGLPFAKASPFGKLKPALAPSPTLSVTPDRGPKKPSILRDDMPHGRSANTDGVHLRDRPVETLRPEDFKPNPLYNEGLTYVYDEVVRGKEARAALSGCIDPKCCGRTFRRFAEAERKAVGHLVTTRAEDIKLLESYLGDEAWKLGSMTPNEKEETWLLAKTWELANKFGKHRYKYSRMPTPPGFWNVDFPNTQERATELKQAEEIRKALVYDRYREARRKGGSWIFRDE